MSLATNLKKISKKLIDKFGNTITLQVKTLGTFDPATGLTTDTITSTITKGVVTDYISERTASGDMKVMFYLDANVDNLDSIIANGISRTVLALVELSMQDSIIIYEAILSGDSRILVS